MLSDLTRADAVPLLEPDAIPEVTLVGELGRGAATAVYLGVRDGREYAVKILNRADEAQAVAFRREAAIVACLDHPGLPRIHHAGDTAGLPYLIMDYITGRSLRRVLQEERPDEIRLAGWAADLALALAVTHRSGLVHRDVKPENIMITQDDRAKLIDLGLAVRTGGAVADVAVGTFLYSAPEQTGMLRRPVDGRADLYALGVVMFECLTGTVPFTADDVGELIRAHLSVPAPDVRTGRPDVSSEFAAVLGRLMAKDPDDRYQSGDRLAADLIRLVAGEHPGDAAPDDACDDTGIVGRDDEYAHLLERWRQARDGQGGTILVRGAAGSGKVQLVRAVAASVRATGHLTLHGSVASDGSIPMGPLRAALDRHLGSVARLDGAERAEAEARLRSAAGDAAALLVSLSPALAALVDAPDPGGTVNDERFSRAVVLFLARLAELSGGMLLDLGDIRDWDEATGNVVGHLATLGSAHQLLTIATAGDDDAGQSAVAALAAAATVALGPLSRQAIEALIIAQLGPGYVPPELVEQLAKRCAGNPFAVQQYVHAAIDAGLLRPSWDGWLLDEDGLAALALPDDVTELIRRRVDGLGDRTRLLLTTAAAVGSRFDPQVVASVSRLDTAEAIAALDEAAGHQLVEPTDGGCYSFLHREVREALLAALDGVTRQQTHQRIAEALEQTAGDVYAIARHYLNGEVERTPDRAFRAAAAAGERALSDNAAAEAIEYLTRAEAAAALAGIEPDCGFDQLLGIAASRTGRYHLARERLDRALRVESDPDRRAELCRELAVVHVNLWGCDEAVGVVRRGLTEFGHPLPRNPVVLGITTILLLVAGIVTGRLPASRRIATGARHERYRRHVELLMTGAESAAGANRKMLVAAFVVRSLYPANRLRPGREYAWSQAGVGVLTSGMGLKGPFRKALHRAAAAGALCKDPGLTAHLHYMAAVARDCAAPMTAATGRAMRRALDEHGRWLDVGTFLTGSWELAQMQLIRGHVTDVEQWCRRGRERTLDPAGSLGSVFAATAAQAAALAGRPVEAAALLAEVRAFSATMPHSTGHAVSIAVAATQLAVEQAETGAAFEDAVAEFEALKLKPIMVWSVQRAFWVHRAFGRLAQCLSAPVDARPDRLREARRAIAALGKAADGPVLRAFHRAATASLRQLRGDDAGALRMLAELQIRLAGLDLPLVEYEMSRVQARALGSLGHTAGAARAAVAALQLATEHGWQTRAHWIRTEFGIDGPAGRVSTRSPSAASSAEGQRQRRLQALQEVSLAAATILDPQEVARIALDETVRIFGAERAFLFLQDAGADALTPYLGRDASGTDVDHLTGYGSTLIERVRQSHEALVVTGTDEGAALGSQSAVVHGLRSIMIAPLLIKGRLHGVIYLDSRAAKGVFTTDDVDTLVALANHVALTLETARTAQLELAVHTAQRERDIAEMLRGAMTDLTVSLEPDVVVDRLRAAIQAALPDSRVCLLHRDDTGALRLAAGDPSGAARGNVVWTPYDPGRDAVVADLLTSTHPVRAGHDPRPVPLPDVVDQDASDWLAVPLTSHSTSRGLLVVATTQRRYSETEAEIAAALAGQGIAALETALLFQQVQALATRDGLTGLFNRRHFFETGRGMLDALPRGQAFSAVMTDIDHFKRINDTHGHGVGDEVIREVGRRLAASLRENDLICRYGGEEFAVLLPATVADESRATAERLHAAVCGEPIRTEAGDLPVTVSVGLAGSLAGDDLTGVLNRADGALYEAKRNGRNQVAAALTGA
jgi:eukaryotic-like serine/threonine-protein kinase